MDSSGATTWPGVSVKFEDPVVVESSKKLSEKTWHPSSMYRIPAPSMSMSVLLVVPSILHDLVIFVDVGRL
jgi:hypothetical protein